MSIFIQAGHHSSASELLMQALYDRGLSRPSAGLTHGLTCHQVAETLEKIITRSSSSESSNKLSDNVMVDLLLANIDYENWGWQAEKNLSALSYWQKFDNDVRFILVFDHPKYVLQSTEINSILDIVEIMEEWTQYHQKLLKFFEDNQPCLLLEGRGALKYFSKLRDELTEREPTLILKSSWQIQKTSKSLNLKDIVNPLSDLVIEESLKHFPEAIQVYNMLLEKSSIKSSDPIYKSRKPTLENLALSLISIQTNTNELLEELDKSKEDNKSLNNRIDELREKLNQQTEISEKNERDLLSARSIVIENEKSLSTIISKKPNNQSPEQENIDLKIENELIINQLHQLQEELERLYLEHGEIKNSNPKNISSNPIINYPLHYGAAEKVRQDLPYRLGSVMVKQSKSVKGLSTLPITLAKEYQEFKKSGNEPDSSLKIEDYHDAYKADKVMNHLSYKLGKALVDSVDSPIKIFRLPISITKEVLKFKKK